MIPDRDIWAAAKILIDHHGDDAAIVASQRQDELLDEGDVDGANIWKAIIKAVEELQRVSPGTDEKTH